MLVVTAEQTVTLVIGIRIPTSIMLTTTPISFFAMFISLRGNVIVSKMTLVSYL